MWDSIAAEITFRSLLVNIAWTLVISGLFRLLMWAFHVSRIKEGWYWIATPLLILAMIMVIQGVVQSENRIDIRPRAEFIDIGDIRQLNDAPSVFLIVSVRNAGAPTMLERWELDLTMDNGAEVKLYPAPVPDTITLTFPKGTRVYSKADNLYLKGLNPAPRRGMIRGLLSYLPTGYLRQDILAAKKGTLHIQDVTGADHTLEIPWREASPNGVPAYFPELGPQQPQAPQSN